MSRGKVVALVGGQYGSEAKGLVAYKLANQFDIHIRTGGPNAGHTFYLNDTEKFVARSIPCGWVNPRADIVIGPGAIIDLDVFAEEFKQIRALGYDIAMRLWIDRAAAVITKAQHHYEGGVHGNAHEVIGSTGEGVGICRMARINRSSIIDGGAIPAALDYALQYKRVEDVLDELAAIDVRLPSGVLDTSDFVNSRIDGHSNVLLEGTQGSGLSLLHGPWPYCTSADTNAGQLAVDAGISPSLVDETILVCRTYPIRVFGNSGPLENETDWETLGQAEETTTVTKKVRRVGAWDSDLVKKSAMLNRPAKVVVTFMNYLFPNYTDEPSMANQDKVYQWVADREQEIDAPIVATSGSPTTWRVQSGELVYG